MFHKLVRNGTIRIVIGQIHDPVLFLGPLGIESLVASRALDYLGSWGGEISIVEPALKHIAFNIGRRLQHKCRINGILIRIFSLAPNIIHYIGNIEMFEFPFCIQDYVCMDFSTK